MNDPIPPIPSGPEVPQKPIPSKKWGLIVVACAIGLFILLDLVTGLQRTTPRPAGQKGSAKPMDSVALQGFDSQTKQMTQDLQRQREALQVAIEKVHGVDLSRLAQPVPECNQAMRDKLGGHYHVTSAADGTLVRLACEPNNQWAVIPEAADSIQPLTLQQQRAMGAAGSGAGSSNGVSRAEQRKQDAQRRREEALNSSSVALDFAGQQNRLPPTDPSAAVREGAPITSAARQEVSEKDNSEKPKYSWDAYTGPVYRVFEGTVIETVLTNRLSGEFTGPVNVMVTTDLYSHDHQHILMPQGSRVLGEAIKVSGQQQHRLAVVFHRVIMPDGYSVDLDKFAGLDQQGAAGLTGKVNTHALKVIGTAVLVGAIGGLAQIGGGYGGGYNPGAGIATGISSQSSQQAVQILDRALNVLPTVTVYEGTRVRIWVEKDAELPAYENHAVSPAL